ncbi:hypothetical protein L2E82_46396 [Cichorium intybus]|uniref:Uncharacterized protein n=1 Tax=Cichorium intybus TaxID=13427 RepID=A0ACB8YTN5_CICIN|nr:hypothetical protein L2E82_46396 [Cichorium intybus]
MLIRLTSFSLFTWTSALLLPSLAFFVSRTTASHRLLHFTATSPYRQHQDVRYENPSPTTTFDYLSSITASLLAVYKVRFRDMDACLTTIVLSLVCLYGGATQRGETRRHQ